MDLAAWFQELRRRRVIRALLGWGLLSFAVLQIVEPVMHALDLKDWVLKVIVAVLAVGFPVAAVLSWFFDLGPGGVSRTPNEGSIVPDARARAGRGALVVVVLVLALAGGALAVVSLRTMDRRLEIAPSVAVLPFADMSPGKDQEYFADGIAEEILNELTQVSGLTVIGRTSSFSFKGKNEDLRAIGQKLGVASILEGSVRRQGDKIRITAQLIRAADGSHLWSRSFDREATDVLAVEADVARAVASALRPRLSSGPVVSRKEPRSANPDAHRLYLLARDLYRRAGGDPSRWSRMRETLQQSIALDGGFAPSWALLGYAEMVIGNLEGTAEANQAALVRARSAATRAIELDPRDPSGYALRLSVSSAELDFAAARADEDVVLALAPASEEALEVEAGRFLRSGRLEDLLAVASRIAESDPLDANMWTALSTLYLRAGDVGAAARAVEHAMDIDPGTNSGAQGDVRLFQGKGKEALEAYAKIPVEPSRLTRIALAQHALGDHAASDDALRSLAGNFAGNWAFQIAEVHAWRGEHDAALEWLERALRQHDVGIGLIPMSPWLAPLRGDPRFVKFVEKVGFPPEVARK